jgi:hypothetical protein
MELNGNPFKQDFNGLGKSGKISVKYRLKFNGMETESPCERFLIFEWESHSNVVQVRSKYFSLTDQCSVPLLAV